VRRLPGFFHSSDSTSFKEKQVKIAAMIARYLLGLLFLVFGSNMFLHFIPMGPMPPGVAGQFSAALFAAHYFNVVGAIMVVSSILLLINRYVPLGLILLAPILVGILFVHILFAPGLPMALIVAALWILTAWPVRSAFSGLLQARVQS